MKILLLSCKVEPHFSPFYNTTLPQELVSAFSSKKKKEKKKLKKEDRKKTSKNNLKKRGHRKTDLLSF